MPIATTYIETVGRRKTASARVRILPAKQNSFVINGKTLEEFFPTLVLQRAVSDVLTSRNLETPFAVSVVVKGGGIASQAHAIRHGLGRALLSHDATLRLDLKKTGLLTRDARMKERRKFGLVKARKAKQWSKR